MTNAGKIVCCMIHKLIGFFIFLKTEIAMRRQLALRGQQMLRSNECPTDECFANADGDFNNAVGIIK
jgi:hypothetical protein